MSTPPTPPAPAGWTKTVKDLMDEMRQGLRTSVGSPETEWAINYERSLLPPGIRFPSKGDVDVANGPVPVTLHISRRSPSTTDVMYTLPAGCGLRGAGRVRGRRPQAVQSRSMLCQSNTRPSRRQPLLGGLDFDLTTGATTWRSVRAS